jgi:hypothetical protein
MDGGAAWDFCFFSGDGFGGLVFGGIVVVIVLLVAEVSSTFSGSSTSFLLFFSLFTELGDLVGVGVGVLEGLGVPFGDFVGVLSTFEGLGVPSLLLGRPFFAEARVLVGLIFVSSCGGVSGADFFIFFELEGGILISFSRSISIHKVWIASLVVTGEKDRLNNGNKYQALIVSIVYRPSNVIFYADEQKVRWMNGGG